MFSRSCLCFCVCAPLWKLHCAPLQQYTELLCAPSTCIVHHRPALCTMVHKGDLKGKYYICLQAASLPVSCEFVTLLQVCHSVLASCQLASFTFVSHWQVCSLQRQVASFVMLGSELLGSVKGLSVRTCCIWTRGL